MLDQAPLHDEADGDHDRDREQDRERHRPVHDGRARALAEPVLDVVDVHHHRIAEEVGSGGIDHRVARGEDAAEGDGAERAQHEERAVGEVDHAKRAEDQRQAEGDERIGAALVEAVQDLEDEAVHRSPSG